MSKFDKALDEAKAVDASSVTDSSTPWKERIVNWMIAQPEPAQTFVDILKATDDKFDPDHEDKKFHYPSRKHCLDSQLTYIRQDFDIMTRVENDKVALLGIVRGDKLVPFKNAAKYLK